MIESPLYIYKPSFINKFRDFSFLIILRLNKRRFRYENDFIMNEMKTYEKI